MNPIEQFFLDLNFSWFISRIAPFFIIQISACLVYVLSRKKVFLRNKIRSIVYALLVLTAPIFFYFYSNPIYQGDLFDLGETPSTKVAEYFGGNVPFITPSDMDGKKMISRTDRYLTEDGVNAVKTAKIPAATRAAGIK